MIKAKKTIADYSYWLFLVIGIMILAGAVPHSFGWNTDPALVKAISGKTVEEIKSTSPSFFGLYDFYFRGGGLSDLGLAFFVIVISLTAFKQGQKWSWYAFCFVPLYFLFWIALSLTLPTETRSTLLPPLIVMVVIGLIGLFSSFKKFFIYEN